MPMNSCSMAGATARAVVPASRSSTGTRRQPSGVWPSAATTASMNALEVGALDPVAGQEADGDAVAAALGQLEVHAAAQQRVGHLHEHPGAVARGRIGAGGAAVLEVGDHGDAALNHLVGGPAVQARDERDATGVVLVAGVVEA